MSVRPILVLVIGVLSFFLVECFLCPVVNAAVGGFIFVHIIRLVVAGLTIFGIVISLS